MPLKYFLCSDGKRCPVEECLNKCPCPEGRCLSLPTLIEISQTRGWTGKPSTTQLINGTRYSYLEITKDYAVDPFDRAFALLGTQHHRRLDAIAQKLNALPEEKLTGEVSGILDLLVPCETCGVEAYELWDYKTSGSFKVAKAIGLVGKKVPDPSGEVYKTSGKWGKAGEPKMITIYEVDPNAVDMWDWELQLNNYRLMIEECGFPIKRMIIQDTVRDGGTFIAQNRGVEKNIYLIPVKKLDNEYVKEYFLTKKDRLLQALATDKLPPPCDSRESWEGNRCKSYCPVVEWCPEGLEIKE